MRAPLNTAAWLGLALIVLGGCNLPKRYEYARVCMGVRASVTLYARERAGADGAAAATFAELARLDAMMSDYRADSEVSRLGVAAGGRMTNVSPELDEVLALAAAVSEASNGAFDATVAPMTRAWRESRRTGELPDGELLEALRGLVAWRDLRVVREGRGAQAVLGRPGMALDLGGIAKGYAAQRGVDLLRRLGYARCQVAMAGDVVVGEAPPGEAGWRVVVDAGVDRREADDHNAARLIVLRNAAISTSGSVEQFVTIGERSYSHIVDPRTGLGSERLVAATVIAPQGADADALATAACLMPAGDLDALLAKFPRSACLLWEAGTKPTLHGDRAAWGAANGHVAVSSVP